MASIVTITTASETVTCGPDGGAEHVFTVSNTSGRPLRIGAQVLVEGQAQESWLAIKGERERDLAAGGTDQITVRVQVPPGTEPGQYTFRLLVYSVRRPGEDFTNGPLVAVRVPAATTPPPEPVERRGFPWWMVAVAVAVLAVGGIAGWWLWPEDVRVPAVVGQDLELAKNAIEEAQLEMGTVTPQETDQQPQDFVLSQEPEAGTQVEKGTPVNLTVATPPAVPEPIDLTKLSPEARWAGGQLVDAHNMRDVQQLPWMGRENDDRGFVRLDRVTMEDGRSVTALRMHPMWVDRGTIKGWHPWVKLPEVKTIQFEAQIGFVQGARHTDGVTFMVWEHHNERGREVWNMIASATKGYTGRLQTITGDLSHLAGQEVGIELRVDAGSSSGQDWAAWVNPRIVFQR